MKIRSHVTPFLLACLLVLAAPNLLSTGLWIRPSEHLYFRQPDGAILVDFSRDMPFGTTSLLWSSECHRSPGGTEYRATGTAIYQAEDPVVTYQLPASLAGCFAGESGFVRLRFEWRKPVFLGYARPLRREYVVNLPIPNEETNE